MQQFNQLVHHAAGTVSLSHRNQAFYGQQRIIEKVRIDLRLQEIIFRPLLFRLTDPDIFDQVTDPVVMPLKS